MTYLYLDSTQLTAPPDLSGAQDSLKYLSIKDAKITSISDDYFTNMNSLETIILDDNDISRVTIGNLPSLKLIYLRNNLLDSMPKLNFLLPQLTDMHLEKNKIANISEAYFNNTPVICRLFMERNKLTTITNFQPALDSMQEIHMKDNLITSESIDLLAEMPLLYQIILSKNKLTDITFGRSDTLWKIYADNNQLTEMPALKASLPALRVLHL